MTSNALPTPAALILFGLIAFLSESTTSAQQPVRNQIQKTRAEVNQVKIDYRDGRPFQYQPSDPWTRSKTFKTHIGHGGKFYNCDGEEDKRNSPYICWKTHHEYDLPPKQKFWPSLQCEIAEIRQRIRDGAGACCQDQGTCDCQTCQSGDVAPSSYEMQNSSYLNSFVKRESSTTQESGFGLVQGKILQPERLQQESRKQLDDSNPVAQFVEIAPRKNATVQSVSRTIRTSQTPKAKTAKRSIMEAFRPERR